MTSLDASPSSRRTLVDLHPSRRFVRHGADRWGPILSLGRKKRRPVRPSLCASSADHCHWKDARGTIRTRQPAPLASLPVHCLGQANELPPPSDSPGEDDRLPGSTSTLDLFRLCWRAYFPRGLRLHLDFAVLSAAKPHAPGAERRILGTSVGHDRQNSLRMAYLPREP